MNIQIRELNPDKEEFPWGLLLSADPSQTIVREYCKKGICSIAEAEGELVGVYVLIWKNPEILELINISVVEKFQGKGFGKRLVSDSIAKAKKLNARMLEVGTGNSSLSQLAFYQKCGFRIYGVERDHFLKNYPEPIYENGILCADMIRLNLSL
ncbi:GNAT family N-acetyltransferase [Leptospira sp. WS92.C1]